MLIWHLLVVLSCVFISGLTEVEVPKTLAPHNIEINNPDPRPRYEQFWDYIENNLKVGPDEIIADINDGRTYHCIDCNNPVEHEVFRYNSTKNNITFFGIPSTNSIDLYIKYPEEKNNYECIYTINCTQCSKHLGYLQNEGPTNAVIEYTYLKKNIIYSNSTGIRTDEVAKIQGPPKTNKTEYLKQFEVKGSNLTGDDYMKIMEKYGEAKLRDVYKTEADYAYEKKFIADSIKKNPDLAKGLEQYKKEYDQMLKDTFLDGKEPVITEDALDEIIPEDYNERVDDAINVVKKNQEIVAKREAKAKEDAERIKDDMNSKTEDSNEEEYKLPEVDGLGPEVGGLGLEDLEYDSSASDEAEVPPMREPEPFDDDDTYRDYKIENGNTNSTTDSEADSKDQKKPGLLKRMVLKVKDILSRLIKRKES